MLIKKVSMVPFIWSSVKATPTETEYRKKIHALPGLEGIVAGNITN